MTRKSPSSHDQQTNSTHSFHISSALKKEQNIMDKMQRFTVVKRNGSIVPFRKERISHAIEAAFRDTKQIAKEPPAS